MDQLTFISNLIGSLTWPVVVLIGLFVFRKPLIKAMNSLKLLRVKGFEVEIVAPEDTGDQEIKLIASILQQSPHSFEWFRENTEFNYTDQQFAALITKNNHLLENVTIISRDENKRKSTPGLPGMRLKKEVRDDIEKALNSP